MTAVSEVFLLLTLPHNVIMVKWNNRATPVYRLTSALWNFLIWKIRLYCIYLKYHSNNICRSLSYTHTDIFSGINNIILCDLFTFAVAKPTTWVSTVWMSISIYAACDTCCSIRLSASSRLRRVRVWTSWNSCVLSTLFPSERITSLSSLQIAWNRTLDRKLNRYVLVLSARRKVCQCPGA